MLGFLRTPLFWFLLLGAGMFVLDVNFIKDQDNTIVISAGDISKIEHQWFAQSGKNITRDMLDALIQELVQERRLYREALALNLDKGDVIIQRRLAQKLRFLSEDVVDAREISEKELKRFFRNHTSQYLTSSTFSFRHIYFNANHPNAKEKLESLLPSLATNEQVNWESFGSPFILGRTFKQQPSTMLSRQFGEEFKTALGGFEKRKWHGPVDSNFGLHLIYLEEVIPSHLPSFDSLHQQVLKDYRLAKRRQSFEEFLAQLVTKYPVVIETRLE